MQALEKEEQKEAFLSALTFPMPGTRAYNKRASATTKHILFAFAMALTPPQGNLDDAGREGNVKGAAGFVKQHTHNPLVFHAIITAPDSKM